MGLQLNGQRVLVTGASKGIGYACALSFAREGAQPIMVARSSETLERAARTIFDETGVSFKTVALDLTSEGATASLFQQAGTLDILVNNAGAIPGGDLTQMDEAKWRAAWELKVCGYINLARLWLPVMQARRKGVIANVIGMAGGAHRNGYLCGTAGNAALIAFTNAIGAESTYHGVRVFGINPGQTRTERIMIMGGTALSAGVAFGRPAEPREVADTLVFACSARSSYLSGTVINLDGGQQFAGKRS